jgi:DNA-binding transcriptional ArsR family regulator
MVKTPVLCAIWCGATAKIFMPYRGYDVFVPAKNIASILNNESNLRILEKLKAKPYYPRELAADMDLSEPFIVRRLKAMEEHDIVEGRWETEGTRRVKRYYPKDINIKLGREGLKVTTEEAPVKRQINIKNELLGTIIRLPLIVLLLYGIFFNIGVVIAAVSVIFVWNAAIDYAFYRDFKLKTPLFSLVVNLFIALLLAAILAQGLIASIPQEIAAVAMAIGLIFVLLALVYRSRFYQMEFDELLEDMNNLMARLENAQVYVKAFYLPTVIRWKANEYFGLI